MLPREGDGLGWSPEARHFGVGMYVISVANFKLGLFVLNSR